MNHRQRFHFFGDPICLASMIIYAVNRWYLKSHHIGGAFTQGYVNDLLCLPLFLPLILGVQRVIGLRKHDAPPRMWEVVQHSIIFSILFEVILPRYPRQFLTTADPWDAVAYLIGGIAAWFCWRFLATRLSPGFFVSAATAMRSIHSTPKRAHLGSHPLPAAPPGQLAGRLLMRAR